MLDPLTEKLVPAKAVAEAKLSFTGATAATKLAANWIAPDAPLFPSTTIRYIVPFTVENETVLSRTVELLLSFEATATNAPTEVPV
jgi:hypothetical protein